MVTRRRFLAQAAPLALVPWVAGCSGSGSRARPQPASTPNGAGRLEFLHGVASGDPLPDAVILWTRLSWVQAADAAMGDVDGAVTPLDVTWLIARDAELLDPVQTGRAQVSAATDFTVKVDVRGLSPGTTYHYQFRAAGAVSPVGRTRTAPGGHVERLRIAVTSCANYPQGFFHAYRKIAERSDLDLVLYLGDYIYEYGNRSYGDGEPIGRVPDPDREIISLADYRRRHAQYKLDPDLQEVHRQHPAVVVWDDHEVADNAYSGGAQNHTPEEEGDWRTRKAAAIQAYHEWMPIRSRPPDESGRIYRTLRWGDIADIIMLDTRLVGRAALAADVCDAALVADPERSILGAEQETWLMNELDSSRARGARFRILGQQVAFGQFLGDPPEPGCIGSGDKWGGYAASRSRILDHIEAGAIENVVVLTGDSHASWGLDVARDPFDPEGYDPATGRGSLAVEIIVPGVSSPGIADERRARASEQRYLDTHPHIRYANQHDQGYALLDLTHALLRAEWYYVSSVRLPEARERLGAAVTCAAGTSHLQLAERIEPK
jgi:alkaline phosphatase D